MNAFTQVCSVAVSAALVLLLLSGCPPAGEQPDPAVPTATPTNAPTQASGQDLSLTSSAFADGAALPAQYTADGDGSSPPLAWSGVPAQTVALALTLEDPDAPSGTFVHWLVYNLPPERGHLPAALPPGPQPEGDAGLSQGRNDGGTTGYYPPSPPPGKLHHYEFRLLALDADPHLPAEATKSQFRAAVAGHTLAVAQLTATYQR